MLLHSDLAQDTVGAINKFMDDDGNIFGWSMGHTFYTSVCSNNKKTIWSVDKQLEWNGNTLESRDRLKQRKLEAEDEYDAPNLGVWLILLPLYVKRSKRKESSTRWRN